LRGRRHQRADQSGSFVEAGEGGHGKSISSIGHEAKRLLPAILSLFSVAERRYATSLDTISDRSRKDEMDRSKQTGFADRLSAAAEARKALLERAARARAAAESPEAVERRAAREAIAAARAARIAERKAARLAEQARQAAALAAAQAAEAAAREAALRAEKESADIAFAERAAREAAEEAAKQAARDARYAARKARKRKGR
jgi:hypothetical protein